MSEGLEGVAAILWHMIADSLRAYVSRRDKFFDRHIEPLQAKILLIHHDYIDGFEEIRQYLIDGTTPPARFVEFLRERRRDTECERQLSRNLAKAIREHRKLGMTDDTWKKVESYCRSIGRYLQASSAMGGVSWYSSFLDTMDHFIELGIEDVWERMPIAPNPRKVMLENASYVLDNQLPKRFNRVSENYAAIRSRLL
jgi:hypothetical protein